MRIFTGPCDLFTADMLPPLEEQPMSSARHVGRMAVTFQLLEFKLGLAPGSIYAVGKTGGSQVMVYVEHESLPLFRGKGNAPPPLIARATLVDAPPEHFEADVAAVLEPPEEHEESSIDFPALHSNLAWAMGQLNAMNPEPQEDPHEHDLHRFDDDGAPQA